MSIGIRVFLSFGTALVIEHANENTICSPQYGFEGTLFLLMAWRAPGRLRKSGSLLMSGTMQGGRIERSGRRSPRRVRRSPLFIFHGQPP